MALNRFSVLPEVKITKTQVLPRTEILLAGLERKEQNYNKTAEALTGTTSELGKLQLYGEAAKKYAGAVQESFKQKASELMTRDLGSGEVMNEVNSYVSAVANDSELNKHIKAKDSADKYLKQIEELKKGGKWNRAQSYEFDKAWEHYSRTGQYHPGLDEATVEEGINMIDEVPKYFRDLKADGSDAIAYLSQSLGETFSTGAGTVSDANSIKLAYKNSYQGVSSQKVIDHANRIFNTFAMSNAGRQLVKEYSMLVDEKAIDPKKTSVDQYLKGTLLGIGMGNVYSQTSTNMDVAQRQAETKRLERAEQTESMEGVLASGPQAYDMKDMAFSADGKLQLSSSKGFGTRLMEAFDGKREWGSVFDGDGVGTPEEVKTKAGIIAFAKANNMSEQEAAKVFSSKNPAIKFNMMLDPKSRKNASELFYSNGAGTYTTMMYYDPETHKHMSAADIINAAKESGAADEKGVELSTDSPTEIKRSMDALGFGVLGKTQSNMLVGNGVVVGYGPKQYIADVSYGGTVNMTKEQKNAYIAENIEYRGAYLDQSSGKIITVNSKGQAVETNLGSLIKDRQ